MFKREENLEIVKKISKCLDARISSAKVGEVDENCGFSISSGLARLGGDNAL